MREIDSLIINGTSLYVLQKYIYALRKMAKEKTLYRAIESTNGPFSSFLTLSPVATVMVFVLNKSLSIKIAPDIDVRTNPESQKKETYAAVWESLGKAEAALVAVGAPYPKVGE